MNPTQLIPATYFYLMAMVQFYDATKAEEYKYNNLQNCIDRLQMIEKADVTEHARLLVIDRKQFQALLPHMGHPEFFRLNKIITDVIDSARMLATGVKQNN